MTTFIILFAAFAVLFGSIIYAATRKPKGKLDFTPRGGKSTHAAMTVHEGLRRDARFNRDEPTAAILDADQTQRLMEGLDSGTMKMSDVQELMEEANTRHVVTGTPWRESEPTVPVADPVPSPPKHNHVEHSTHFPHHIEHSSHFEPAPVVDTPSHDYSSHDSHSSHGSYSSDSGGSFDGGSSDGGGSSGGFD